MSLRVPARSLAALAALSMASGGIAAGDRSPLAPTKQGPAIGAPDAKTAAELDRLHRVEGLNGMVLPEGDAIMARIGSRLSTALGWESSSPRVRLEDCSGYLASTRAFDDVRVCRNVLFTAKSEDEIAWLVAHEYGHLAHRDKERIAGGLTAPNTFTQALANVAILGALVVAPPAILAVPTLYGRTETAVVKEAGRRSKQDEFAADEFAFHLMVKANYNPLAGMRAYACMDAQTTDCTSSEQPAAASAPAKSGKADKVVDALLPVGWIRTYSHPSIDERVKRAAVVLASLPHGSAGFTPLPPIRPGSPLAEYQRKVALADEISATAATTFAESLRARSVAEARAALCMRRRLPQSARTLLSGPLGQDRAFRSLGQAIGALCADDALVQSGAEFGPGSSYVGDVTAFVWRTRGQRVAGNDPAFVRAVVRYGDEERIYRELRWIPLIVERSVDFRPATVAACRTSPNVQARQMANTGFLYGNQNYKVNSFCNAQELYGPDWSKIDLDLYYWFDPDRATRPETRFWAEMLLRTNFDLLCIVQSGYILAGKPETPIAPLNL